MNFNPFAFGNPASLGQQTRATQLIQMMGGGMAGGRSPTRRKRRASAKSAPRRRKASAAKRRAPSRRAKPARLVKGSAAARAYMAKIRRKRR
jgi:hypothetical protein